MSNTKEMQLEALHPADRERSVDVVFVHGLKGDGASTWTHKNKSYWPQWISDDCPSAGVWVCTYPTTLLDFFHRTLSIEQLAVSLAHCLRNAGVGDRPIVFVGHSLGGLLIKAMLCDAAGYAKPNLKRIWHSTHAIAFMGTPHAGSDLATWKSGLQRLVAFGVEALTGVDAPKAKSNADELHSGAEGIFKLSRHFRELVDNRRQPKPDDLDIVAYYEKLAVAGKIVVDEQSADPQLAGVEVVPLLYDHFGICKLESKESAPYGWVKRQIRGAADLPDPYLAGRVLISYPRRQAETPGSDDRVLCLMRALRGKGIHVETDIRLGRVDWATWRNEQFRAADTIVVVGHEAAREAFDGGGDFTGATMTRNLFDTYCQPPRERLLPLLFDGDPATHLPQPLLNWYSGLHFPSDFDDLVAAICEPPVRQRA